VRHPCDITIHRSRNSDLVVQACAAAPNYALQRSWTHKVLRPMGRRAAAELRRSATLGISRHRVGMLAAMLSLSLSGGFALSSEGPDILAIYDQMVTSRAAAQLCSPPTADVMLKFESNFAMVSLRAREEVQKRSPSMSGSDIRALMSRRSQAFEVEVKKLVEARGCSNKDIAVVVTRYRAQAQWDPRK
jgi:hypothetical protein